MKIKILWGFIGVGKLLGATSNKIKAGEVFEDADDEYGHALIGKGLAEEVGAGGKPKLLKPRNPKPAEPEEIKGEPQPTAVPAAGPKDDQAAVPDPEPTTPEVDK